MVVDIVWTRRAKRQLREISDYYKETAGKNVAQKLRNNIQDRTIILVNNPLAGQREVLLADRIQEFRYLVEGNYKIIYWAEPGKVFIAAVFDCRQDPEKMRKDIGPPYPTMLNED